MPLGDSGFRGIVMNRIKETCLSYIDEQGTSRVWMPSAAAGRMTVGRSHRSDFVLSWDPMVSRLHAVIEWTGTHWDVIDDGLSRNGTFVNGERLTGRRHLRSGDIISIGATEVTFHGQERPGCGETQERVFTTALAEHRIIFDVEAAHAYLFALAGAAPAQNTMSVTEGKRWCTDERLLEEAHDFADRVRGSLPGDAGERDYYAFTLNSTGDLLANLARSMMIINEANAAGALPASIAFRGLAHKYTSAVRELSKAPVVKPFRFSKAGYSGGYLIIGSDVIEDLSMMFEAVGSLLLDHNYRPERALRGADPLLVLQRHLLDR
ncbi:FHA domain protein (plasmid) [Rhodococcus opacus]|uniref:FHA domain protein n=1 Tax=Rhodococcus opacus TaxID=37919 RepID=A0A1B1KIZ0_RHOOP|nr:FHA domain-containing protein [Rhodococcus opacus]ANS32553.1 FHA domain protein [Rhodococcus opacus]